jgi:hypothetical protein
MRFTTEQTEQGGNLPEQKWIRIVCESSDFDFVFSLVVFSLPGLPT